MQATHHPQPDQPICTDNGNIEFTHKSKPKIKFKFRDNNCLEQPDNLQNASDNPTLQIENDSQISKKEIPSNTHLQYIVPDPEFQKAMDFTQHSASLPQNIERMQNDAQRVLNIDIRQNIRLSGAPHLADKPQNRFYFPRIRLVTNSWPISSAKSTWKE